MGVVEFESQGTFESKYKAGVEDGRGRDKSKDEEDG